MNISELIERLEEIRDFNPEARVMIATQPSYPITETLRGVTCVEDFPGSPDDFERVVDDVVWLVSGGAPGDDISPYAPSWVFEASN